MNDKRSTLLTKEEEYELVQKAQNGDEKALERLVEANMGLVVKVASDCIKRIGLRSPSVSFEDAVSAGIEGLFVGISKFDVSKGYKLSTYIYWWIMNHVRKLLITNMPFGNVSIRTAERSFTDSEFAPVSQIPASLNDDENPIDIPFEEEWTEDMKPIGEKILEVLKHKKKLPEDRDFCVKLITLRYGLETGVPLTLRETGEMLGVSHEYVRQIEQKILGILAKDEKIKGLRDVIS
jgi:RNA polymerase primary sigma factor